MLGQISYELFLVVVFGWLGAGGNGFLLCAINDWKNRNVPDHDDGDKLSYILTMIAMFAITMFVYVCITRAMMDIENGVVVFHDKLFFSAVGALIGSLIARFVMNRWHEEDEICTDDDGLTEAGDPYMFP